MHLLHAAHACSSCMKHARELSRGKLDLWCHVRDLSRIRNQRSDARSCTSQRPPWQGGATRQHRAHPQVLISCCVVWPPTACHFTTRGCRQVVPHVRHDDGVPWMTGQLAHQHARRCQVRIATPGSCTRSTTAVPKTKWSGRNRCHATVRPEDQYKTSVWRLMSQEPCVSYSNRLHACSTRIAL